MTHLNKWSADFGHIFYGISASFPFIYCAVIYSIVAYPPPSRVQGRQPLRAPEAKRRARCVANATTAVRAFRSERQRTEKSGRSERQRT